MSYILLRVRTIIVPSHCLSWLRPVLWPTSDLEAITITIPYPDSLKKALTNDSPPSQKKRFAACLIDFPGNTSSFGTQK